MKRVLVAVVIDICHNLISAHFGIVAGSQVIDAADVTKKPRSLDGTFEIVSLSACFMPASASVFSNETIVSIAIHGRGWPHEQQNQKQG